MKLKIREFIKKFQDMFENGEISLEADICIRIPYKDNPDLTYDQFDFDFDIYRVKYEENDILTVIPNDEYLDMDIEKGEKR